MTHDDEAEFHKAVGGWLEQSFVDVEHEPRVYTTETEGADGEWVIPDFIAHSPFRSYVIEVKSSADKLYESIGQAGIYSLETGHDPVVVFPVHDKPEADVPDWLTVVTV